MDGLFSSSASELFNKTRALGTFAELSDTVNLWKLTLAEHQYAINDALLCFKRYSETAGGCCAADSSSTALLSCLSTCYSETYCHAEMAFALTTPVGRKLVAYMVDLPSPRHPTAGVVRPIQRNTELSYNVTQWDVISLSLAKFTPLELAGLFVYCKRQEDKPMNRAGLQLNFLPVLRWFAGEPLREESSYFCSQLVASALRWVRPPTFVALDPRRATPLGIFNYMYHVSLASDDGVATPADAATAVDQSAVGLIHDAQRSALGYDSALVLRP